MALTTLAAVKLYMGITDTSLDTQIAALIPRAQVGIESYISRSIELGARTETRDGNGGTVMMLREHPVASVQSLTIDGITIPQAAAAGRPGWRLTSQRLILLNGYRFNADVQNVDVAYTAGFATVPGDIEQACIEVVALMYRRPDHLDFSSKTLAGETIAYLTGDMTPSAKATLKDYRRVAPLL